MIRLSHTLIHALILTLLAALLAALPASAREVRFDQGALERRFQLHLPDAPDGPLPLVVVLHGAFMNDQRMIVATRGRWEKLAQSEGIAVAIGSGLHRLWDIGQGDGAELLVPRRNDLAYIDQMIAETGRIAAVDPERIFVVGLSMGGQMTYAYACQRDTVRAIATVAMPLPMTLSDECEATRPRPALIIHGTADPVVDYDGGDIPAGPGISTQIASHGETLGLFARRAGCEAPGPVQVFDKVDDGTRAELVRWQGCDLPIWGLTIKGMGHHWPGGGPDLPDAVIGPGTEELDGAVFVWAFFSQFD